MTLQRITAEYPIGCVVAYANYSGAARHARVIGYQHYMNGHYILRCSCEPERPGGSPVTRTINPKWVGGIVSRR